MVCAGFFSRELLNFDDIQLKRHWAWPFDWCKNKTLWNVHTHLFFYVRWRHVSNFAMKEYQIKCHVIPIKSEARDCNVFPTVTEHFHDSIYWKMSASQNKILPWRPSLNYSRLAFRLYYIGIFTFYDPRFLFKYLEQVRMNNGQWKSESNKQSHAILSAVLWDESIQLMDVNKLRTTRTKNGIELPRTYWWTDTFYQCLF